MNKDDLIDDIYSKIESLREHFHSGTVTEALQMINEIRLDNYSEVKSKQSDVKANDICPIPHLIPSTDYEMENTKSFEEYEQYIGTFLDEDYCNRSKFVYLDPKVSLFKAFVDLHLGRIQHINVTGVSMSDESLEDIEKKAIEFVKTHTPYLSVNLELFSSNREAAEALRTLADLVDNNDSIKDNNKNNTSPNFGFSSIPQCMCIKTGVELGSKFWVGGNRELKQKYREVFKCYIDGACGPIRTYTKKGPWKTKTEWINGNPKTEPPILPEKFIHVDWDNRCPVLDSFTGIKVTSGFGWRNLNGKMVWHSGIDINAPVGKKIYAPIDGKVYFKDTDAAQPANIGVHIVSGSFVRQLWHLKPDSSLTQGKNIKKGDLLGKIVTHPNGDHLHFVRYKPKDLSKWWKWDRKLDSLEPCP